MNRIIRNYLIQDLNDTETTSYFKYILEGKLNSTLWIEKTNNRRDILIQKNLLCDHIVNNTVCGSWININEKGMCFCSNNHVCNNVILNVII